MKILVISSYIFGYMDFAVKEMERQGHMVEVLYYENEPLKFEYKTITDKIISGIGKIAGKNAKKTTREKKLKQFLKYQKFDFTLVIHGQYLNDNTHKFLKSISTKYVAYFFDSLMKMPSQKRIVHHFDKVFSYEPIDCENEELSFITNFIPTEILRNKDPGVDIFNISAHDNRVSILQNLAKYLKEEKIDFKFLLYSRKLFSLEGFEITNKKIDFKIIMNEIQQTKVIVDIQREEQEGLSFRVFEAIGNEKKLITTNEAIDKYPFYNPQNILILKKDNICIPKDFLNSPYIKVPENIYKNYTVESWVNKILN